MVKAGCLCCGVAKLGCLEWQPCTCQLHAHVRAPGLQLLRCLSLAMIWVVLPLACCV